MKTTRISVVLFAMIVLALNGCKKKDPIIDQEEDPKREVILLLDKLTEKAILKVQASEAGDMADVEFTSHTLYEYSADSLLVKTTRKYDKPAALEYYWAPENDAYDTYEYEGGKLVKRNEFRRRNAQQSDPIELTSYATFQYDNTGRPGTMSSYSQVRTPPNGDFAFKETRVTNYTYDSQQRLTRVENLNYRFEGGEYRVLSGNWIVEYTYGSDGNIAKLTEYRGHDEDGNGQIAGPEISKDQELEYSGYGTQPNPTFNPSVPAGGIGLLTTFKHFPTTIKRTGFPPVDSGIPPIVATDRYQFTYREDGYPAAAKADLESKFIGQGGVIKEEKQVVNYEFAYQE